MVERVIWRLTGADRAKFLQGIVTNDVLRLEKAPGMVWTALLTPQGKYLADFFVIRPEADMHTAAEPDTSWLIDIPAPLAEGVLKRLTLYKLRADVQITPSDLHLTRGIGAAQAGALADPRHPALGWRSYGALASQESVDWDAIRVEALVPEYPNELRPDDSFILEFGFDRLSGVDFRKGCYVGQEVTARMKHKTELKKGLVRLAITGAADPGSEITLEDGRVAGVLGTASGGRALAWMRFDRLGEALVAGDARLHAEG